MGPTRSCRVSQPPATWSRHGRGKSLLPIRPEAGLPFSDPRMVPQGCSIAQWPLWPRFRPAPRSPRTPRSFAKPLGTHVESVLPTEISSNIEWTRDRAPASVDSIGAATKASQVSLSRPDGLPCGVVLVSWSCRCSRSDLVVAYNDRMPRAHATRLWAAGPAPVSNR